MCWFLIISFEHHLHKCCSNDFIYISADKRIFWSLIYSEVQNRAETLTKTINLAHKYELIFVKLYRGSLLGKNKPENMIVTVAPDEFFSDVCWVVFRETVSESRRQKWEQTCWTSANCYWRNWVEREDLCQYPRLGSWELKCMFTCWQVEGKCVPRWEDTMTRYT